MLAAERRYPDYLTEPGDRDIFDYHVARINEAAPEAVQERISEALFWMAQAELREHDPVLFPADDDVPAWTEAIGLLRDNAPIDDIKMKFIEAWHVLQIKLRDQLSARHPGIQHYGADEMFPYIDSFIHTKALTVNEALDLGQYFSNLYIDHHDDSEHQFIITTFFSLLETINVRHLKACLALAQAGADLDALYDEFSRLRLINVSYYMKAARCLIEMPSLSQEHINFKITTLNSMRDLYETALEREYPSNERFHIRRLDEFDEAVMDFVRSLNPEMVLVFAQAQFGAELNNLEHNPHL